MTLTQVLVHGVRKHCFSDCSAVLTNEGYQERFQSRKPFAGSLAFYILETYSQMLCSFCGHKDDFREAKARQEVGAQSCLKGWRFVDRLRACFNSGSELGTVDCVHRAGKFGTHFEYTSERVRRAIFVLRVCAQYEFRKSCFRTRRTATHAFQGFCESPTECRAAPDSGDRRTFPLRSLRAQELPFAAQSRQGLQAEQVSPLF